MKNKNELYKELKVNSLCNSIVNSVALISFFICFCFVIAYKLFSKHILIEVGMIGFSMVFLVALVGNIIVNTAMVFLYSRELKISKNTRVKSIGEKVSNLLKGLSWKEKGYVDSFVREKIRTKKL